MKVYRVTVETEYFVVAADNDAAIDAAEKYRSEYLREYSDECFSSTEEFEPRNAHFIPKEWRGCLPYGGDGTTTIEQYLAQQVTARDEQP